MTFQPNPEATFSPVRPRRERDLHADHTLAYVVARQRIVRRETGRILAEREELATLQAPSFLHNEDNAPHAAARLADAASAVGGFSIRYGTGDAHVSAQVSYGAGFYSLTPAEDAYLSDYRWTRPDGTYVVSEASARKEEARRNRANAARKTRKAKRSGRVTKPCIELDLDDRDGAPIAVACESKEQAQRVHADNGKERNRCLSRLRMVAKREREAAAANARDDVKQDAERVAAAVATNATGWDQDARN